MSKGSIVLAGPIVDNLTADNAEIAWRVELISFDWFDRTVRMLCFKGHNSLERQSITMSFADAVTNGFLNLEVLRKYL